MTDKIEDKTTKEVTKDDEVKDKASDHLEVLRDYDIDEGRIYAGDGIYL